MATNPRWISKFELKPGTWVFVPSESCIANGKDIKSSIEKLWNPPSYFYHLQKGGHVKALKKHLKSNSFINLDIKNFFGSINKSRVTRCVKKLIGYERAREIARESTVLHPVTNKLMLPFGFVQSPILASLCLSESTLGIYLKNLNCNRKVSVSVYMDDIIISTRKDADLNQILCDIKSATDKSKFELNSQKEEGPSAEITAFNIILSNKYLEIEKRRFDKFMCDYRDSTNDYQRKGIKNYIDSVNPHQVASLY